MNVLKRLFGKAPTSDADTSQRTPLHAVLSKITPGTAARIMEDEKLRPKARLQSAMTMVILWHANKHYDGLRELSKTVPGADWTPEHYDVVVFEIAAYCHWFLLRDYLACREDEEEQEEQEDEDEPDGYKDMVMGSLHCSAAFLNGQTSFTIPESFFVNRACSYSTHNVQPLLETATSLERKLISSIAKRAPATQKEMSLGSLSVEVAAKAEVAILHSATLPSIESTAKDLYRRAVELNVFLSK